MAMVGVAHGSKLLAEQVVLALYEELDLSPKPGLVDRLSTGSHEDMNYAIMDEGIRALEPYFERMALISQNRTPSRELRQELSDIGKAAESAMYEATHGVNTHKGAIWSLGLLVSALAITSPVLTLESILETAQSIALFPLFSDDAALPSKILTHGEEVYERYHVGGAAKEAQNGFPHIRHYAYPTLTSARNRGDSEQCAKLDTLLCIMAHLPDTCILYRCGAHLALEIQNLCQEILDLGGYGQIEGQKRFQDLQKLMLKEKASPGGAADLLAATLFIDHIIELA